MPVDPQASVRISAFKWVPPFAQGYVRDLRARWALEEAGVPYAVRGVIVVFRNHHPSWIRSLSAVRRLIYFMWLNRFWSESRGLSGKSKRGFRAQPPMPDTVH